MTDIDSILTMESIDRKIRKFLPNWNIKDTLYNKSFSTIAAATVAVNFDNDAQLHKFYVWCQTHFGDDWIWSCIGGHAEIFFVNEEDAVVFKLTHGYNA